MKAPAGLDLLSALEAFYKDIHAHPELSMQEVRTSAIIADRLDAAAANPRGLRGKDRGDHPKL